jgi:hypothetical protein
MDRPPGCRFRESSFSVIALIQSIPESAEFAARSQLLNLSIGVFHSNLWCEGRK